MLSAVGGCADQCCGRVGRTDTSAYAINNRSLLSEADAETGEEEGEVPGATRINGVLYPLMLAMEPLASLRPVPFWAGYGASSTLDVMGTGKLPYISLVTAFFIGMGGTKWLQSERDKGRWQAAAGSSALAKQHHQLQLKLSLALSDQTSQIAAAAAFERFSPAGPRRGVQPEPGWTSRSNPREDARHASTPPGQGDGIRARVPAELGDGVRAVGPPQQASGSG